MEQIKNLFKQISSDDEVIKVITNHSLRVMYMANKLAKAVGVYCEDLRIAALLHDIGKIGVNRNILFKQDRLTDLEYTVIQSHCHIGNSILRKQLGLTKAAKFLRDHHERWDGRGYPRGLIGDQISVEGRIINICDSFDTMTLEKRTYKQLTMSFDEAYDELRNCSWKQFDGKLVDQFISLMKGLELPNVNLWYNNPEIMKAIFEPESSFKLELRGLNKNHLVHFVNDKTAGT